MIYKFDYRYMLSVPLVKSAYRNNFRKIYYKGLENIPKDKPVIYAPNHRNAVVDGLNIVNISKKQVVFLARADIFSNKFLSWFLKGVKVMPVYRIRDGKDNLERNNEIFENCSVILGKGNSICLFPEAKHNPRQSLLPLQKGIPRIAILTENISDFELGTQIVPVATYYTDMTGFMSDVYVEFGNPIDVDSYKEMYSQNPNLAVNNLRKDLDKTLRDLMVDISNTAYYDFYIDIINLCGKQYADKYYKDDNFSIVKAAKDIVNKLDDLFVNDRPKFLEVVNDYGRIFSILAISKLRTDDPINKNITIDKLMFSFLWLLIIAPIAILGYLNTIFPIIFYRIIRKKIKDRQFIASLRIVSALFFMPIFYFIQALVIGLVFKSFPIALVYLLLSPAMFRLFSYWYKYGKDFIRKFKVFSYQKSKKEEISFIKSLINFDYFH